MEKLVVVSVKNPSNAGGAEIVWENLKKQGLEFYAISLDSPNLPNFYDKITNKFHLKEIFASKWLIKKAIQKKSKIIIYDKIFGWPKQKTRAKKICYNHGSYTLAGMEFKNKNWIVYLFYRYIMKYFEKKSYRNADKIIAVSESVKKEMVDYFKTSKEKITVINNGIDLEKFKEIKNKTLFRKKYNLPKNKKIIFFPGRASFGKGFDIAEKVLEKLGDNYFMFVLGKGNSRSKNIKFIGKIDNDKMSEVYNCADLCIFPSRYEGFGLGIIESGACGVPLVLSDVGVMKNSKKMEEFIAESVDDYVRKIKKLNLEESGKRWKSFSKEFSLEKQISEFNKLLK